MERVINVASSAMALLTRVGVITVRCRSILMVEPSGTQTSTTTRHLPLWRRITGRLESAHSSFLDVFQILLGLCRERSLMRQQLIRSTEHLFQPAFIRWK